MGSYFPQSLKKKGVVFAALSPGKNSGISPVPRNYDSQ